MTISISSAPASTAILHSVTFILLNVWEVGKAPATAAILTFLAVSFSFTTAVKFGYTQIAATFGMFEKRPEKLFTLPVKCKIWLLLSVVFRLVRSIRFKRLIRRCLSGTAGIVEN